MEETYNLLTQDPAQAEHYTLQHNSELTGLAPPDRGEFSGCVALLLPSVVLVEAEQQIALQPQQAVAEQQPQVYDNDEQLDNNGGMLTRRQETEWSAAQRTVERIHRMLGIPPISSWPSSSRAKTPMPLSS